PAAGRGEADRAVRGIIAELRDACGACAYRRICGFAPVGFQIARVRDGERVRHAHHAVLKEGVERIVEVPGWEKALLPLLGEREKDALLAGCLLATAWGKKPERMAKLIAYTADRTGVDELREEANAGAPPPKEAGPFGLGAVDPEKLRTRMVRGQVLRAAAFARTSEELRRLAGLLVLDHDEEGRLFQYEAVAALSLLVGVERPGEKWISELEAKARSAFRATFAARATEDGAIQVFFPYRRGKRRSYLVFSRDSSGNEVLASFDKLPIDDLLVRIFSVFDTDEKKTWRIFKEVCRHLNVRAGKLDLRRALAGFERLERDDLLLLGLYAPALARVVGRFLDVEGFHLLVKLLYKLRAESSRRGGPVVAAHEKVAGAREEWSALRKTVGDAFVKEVFALIFRLNESYEKASYTTDTYIGIGEVAYLLTAVSGWNPRGLELELASARKALALVAYGLQPPDKNSAIRAKHLARARERVRGDELERACELGMRYMAGSHGCATFEELLAGASSGVVSPGSGSSGENRKKSTSELAVRDELDASADRLPSLDAERRESDDAPRDDPVPPAREKSGRRSLPRTAGSPGGGLVGQRNLETDDESAERPSRKARPLSSRKKRSPDD
ncbi:hypothetical protein HY251_22140, partial [bacterium]|nr:hypothetical protein [bacterium]